MNSTSIPEPPAEGTLPTVKKSRRQILWNQARVRFQIFLLLGLLLVNPRWYIYGIPLILLGQALRAWAAGYISKDRRLAQGGPYSLCRHPLYLGTFLSSVGMSVLVGNLYVAVITVAVFLIIYLPMMRGEEDYLQQVYGEEYREYMTQVPGFIPHLRFSRIAEGQSWTWRQLIRNEEHLTWLAIIAFLIVMILIQRYR